MANWSNGHALQWRKGFIADGVSKMDSGWGVGRKGKSFCGIQKCFLDFIVLYR